MISFSNTKYIIIILQWRQLPDPWKTFLKDSDGQRDTHSEIKTYSAWKSTTTGVWEWITRLSKSSSSWMLKLFVDLLLCSLNNVEVVETSLSLVDVEADGSNLAAVQWTKKYNCLWVNFLKDTKLIKIFCHAFNYNFFWVNFLQETKLGCLILCWQQCLHCCQQRLDVMLTTMFRSKSYERSFTSISRMMVN